MTTLLIYHALLIGAYAVAVLLMYARWTGTAALVLFATAGAGMWVSLDMLGRPRPYDQPPDMAVLLAMAPVPNEAIYLWTVTPGYSEPHSIVIPWNDAKAQRMAEQLEGAESKGGVLRFERIPGEPGEFKIELPPSPGKK